MVTPDTRLTMAHVQAAGSGRNDIPSGVSNVVGLGVQTTKADNGQNGLPKIVVLVRKKLPIEELSSEQRLPTYLGQIPVSVEEVGEITAFSGFRSRYRPVCGGVSISLASRQNSGTLGCFVRKVGKERQKRLFLSNNHVIADSNAATIGSEIIQQGRGDRGRPAQDVIGTLHSFHKIDFSADNEIDAALGELLPPERVKRRLAIIRRESPRDFVVPLSAPYAPEEGLQVHKSGRSTGPTSGHIDLLGVSINVNYPGHGTASFINQFRVADPQTPFSEPGDSGALVYTREAHPVGLLFAGGTAGGRSFTFCHDIRAVLDTLEVVIDSGGRR